VPDDWEWVLDDGAELELDWDESFDLPGEDPLPHFGGNVLIGTVVLDGIERRVWRLGFYCSIEGVTDSGIKVPALIRLVGAEQAAALDHDTFSGWSRTVAIPALPQAGVADATVLRLKCTGPAGCRLAVGVPSGRVRGAGAGGNDAAWTALEWFHDVQEFDDGATPLWPFEGAYAARAGASAVESLASSLTSWTGARGRQRNNDAGAYTDML